MSPNIVIKNTMSDTSESDMEEGVEHAYVPRATPSPVNGTAAAAKEQQAKQIEEPPATFCSRIKCIAFFIFIGIGVIVGLSLILTGRANPVSYFVPVDPPGKSEANRWDATAGLTLMVENACTDDWNPFFEASIKAWNETDALNLKTSRVSVDPQCSPRNGRLKVCNSDYGDTPWHGINIILIDKFEGTIVHSTSQLNDRFMDDDADRTYLMCHENGHGFGLPHTDEDHFNRDRGDCMDYTIRTRNNQVPGRFNLDLLVQLYGTPAKPLAVDPKTLPKDGEAVASTGSDPTQPPPQQPPTNNNNGGNNNGGNKDKEDKKEKDKEKDRRLDQGSGMSDADIVALEREVAMECEDEFCIVDVDDQFRILINQFLRAP